MRSLLYLCLLLAGSASWAWQEAPEDSSAEATLDGDRLEWTGWLDVLYRDNDLPATERFFNLGHVYLGASYRLTSSWLAFVEIEYEREPPYGDEQTEDNLKIDRAYLEYRRSAAARLRMGKLNTPAGIWKPEHWALTVDTVASPIMEYNGFIPIKSEGIEFSGIKALTQGELHYTIIGAYIDDEESRQHNLEDAKALGGDLHLNLSDRWLFGLSVYSYTGSQVAESSVGLLPYFDLELVRDRLSWRSELLSLRRNAGENTDSFYTQLKYHFNPTTYLNLRHDAGDDEWRANGLRHYSNTLTLAWWVRSNWRVKWEYEQHSISGEQLADFDQWSAWTGYIFR
jgi:hypothetical protein